MNKSDLLENLKSKKASFSEEDLDSSIHLILQFISSTLGEANRVEIRNKINTTKLQLHAIASDSVYIDNIGEYEPATGVIKLVGIRVDSIVGGNNFIKISADAANPSVSSPGQNQILQFDDGPSFVQATVVTTS